MYVILDRLVLIRRMRLNLSGINSIRKYYCSPINNKAAVSNEALDIQRDGQIRVIIRPKIPVSNYLLKYNKICLILLLHQH